jgi:hypothetical protein
MKKAANSRFFCTYDSGLFNLQKITALRASIDFLDAQKFLPEGSMLTL